MGGFGFLVFNGVMCVAVSDFINNYKPFKTLLIMSKNSYESPKMEQVRVEAEMPVMAASAPAPGFSGNLNSFKWH